MCSRKAECIIRKKGNKGSSQGRERTEYKKTGILGIFGEIVLLESSIIISPKLSWRSLGNYYYYNIGKTKEDGCSSHYTVWSSENKSIPLTPKLL